MPHVEQAELDGALEGVLASATAGDVHAPSGGSRGEIAVTVSIENEAGRCGVASSAPCCCPASVLLLACPTTKMHWQMRSR